MYFFDVDGISEVVSTDDNGSAAFMSAVYSKRQMKVGNIFGYFFCQR